MPYIEYSFVIEPESLIVFQEYEYQQVQVMCSHCNDDITHNNITEYALTARRLRKRRVRNMLVAKKVYYTNKNKYIKQHNQQMIDMFLKLYILNMLCCFRSRYLYDDSKQNADADHHNSRGNFDTDDNEHNFNIDDDGMEDIDHDSCNCDDDTDDDENCDSQDFADADHNNIVEDFNADKDEHGFSKDVDGIEDKVYTSVDVLETHYQQCQMEVYNAKEKEIEHLEPKTNVSCTAKGLILDPTEDYDADDFEVIIKDKDNVGKYGIRGHSCLLPSDGKHILKAQRLGNGLADSNHGITDTLHNSSTMYTLLGECSFVPDVALAWFVTFFPDGKLLQRVLSQTWVSTWQGWEEFNNRKSLKEIISTKKFG